MRKKRFLVFFMIATVLGFMLAIQFQTTQEPVVRDTRDIWELRQDLKKGQEFQSDLMDEIINVDRILKEYEGSTQKSKVEALKEQKEELKTRVGLTELTGSGIVLKVDVLFNDIVLGQAIDSIPPELLQRLVNELNRYNAEAISIADQRIISTTPIRNVNNLTYVNNSPLPPLPIEIKVIAKNAEKLHNRMVVSQSIDEFAIEGLEIISSKKSKVTLPPYTDPLRIKFMEPVESINTAKEKG